MDTYYESNEPDSQDYPKAILKMAKAEKFNKEYDASIEHHLAAMKLFEERNMMEAYADAASSLQLCYIYAGKKMEVDSKDDISKAASYVKLNNIIKEELGYLDLTKKYFSKLAYAQSLSTIAGCYMQMEKYDHALMYYKQYMAAIREGVRDEFRMQSEAERMATWTGEVSNNVQILENLLVTFPYGNDSLRNELVALVYDVELLSKGVLLNSAIEFEKVLAAKGDKELEVIYSKSKQNETAIKKLRENAVSQEDLDRLLRLIQENQALLLNLYKGCAEFADFTDYISYSWQDVQHRMGKTDVAIEFVAVDGGILNDEKMMVALVLARDMNFPVAVSICNVETARKMEESGQLFDWQNNPVWSVLSRYLVGKRRIFFAADGIFNRIGIEYLLYDGKPLSEQFEVYRLSSTKELCYRHEAPKLKKVALFGNINYNDAVQTAVPIMKSQAVVRGAGDAKGFANLSYTFREINEIQTILKQNKIENIMCFTDVEASSDAFKCLTDSNVNLLHIATHGMYSEVDESTDAESMANSLLIFAGANMGNKGFLPASEVAAMNLRQCDLAVLSACETGLGKLGEDGVFGLQRGFKNAGVHTLLMSLKNVYDDSTAELMIGFYKNLMKGATKREALVKAQQEIRDKGFEEAKYWATFILLDAY